MYKSCAEWPKDAYTNEFGTHVSTDEHQTKEQAEGVCRMLKKFGFAGVGKHFPLKTWVEKIEQPTTDKGQNSVEKE